MSCNAALNCDLGVDRQAEGCAISRSAILFRRKSREQQEQEGTHTGVAGCDELVRALANRGRVPDSSTVQVVVELDIQCDIRFEVGGGLGVDVERRAKGQDTV